MSVETVAEPQQELSTEAHDNQQRPPRSRKSRKVRKPIAEKLRRLFQRHPKALAVGWSFAILVFLLVIPVAYLCWYVAPPSLWNWANEAWWHWIFAIFGFLFLFSIPIYVAAGASSLVSFVADLSLSIESAMVTTIHQAVRETENEAIRRLEDKDEAGLLPLLKYSRAQLEAYYRVGLSQTRRGFFNSVLAMWLGFLLLLVGVALYVGPVEKLGFKTPSHDFRILIIGGAAIIEFISALFLWVYRSSTSQLTYFYNRQMQTHTSILCFRIASTMDPAKADDVKRAIVDKVLDWTSVPEKIPLVGAKGFRALLPTAGQR